MIGIGRFFTWPAQISDWPVSLTSCRFWADPFIASGTGNDVTATRTLTCKHISRVNTFRVRMILILIATDNVFMSCQMRLAQPEWVCERQHTQSNSQKFIDAYCGRKKKKKIFTKYDLDKQHYTAMMFPLISISTRLQCDTDFIQ